MKRYRIGLLAAHSAIDYPRSIRMGVQNTIEEAGHTLVVLADLIPYHTLTNAEAYLRVAIEIAKRLDLDAAIVPVGCLTANMSGDSAKALEFVQGLDSTRTLVIDREVEGYRSLTKDNAPGMHQCMRHLIEECGYTKIAFVSGPEHSKGAHERETIYFEEMAAHGLKVTPEMFVRGDFGGDCAEQIEQIIDQNPGLEAIACACDLIAYTTYAVLHKRHLAVGDDIAVTGFDDNDRSAHLDPPLSTVHMTGYDLGCAAAREALRMCAGLPQQEPVISSTFIARSSCSEGSHSSVDRFRELLRCQPFPVEEVISIMMESALVMAGPSVEQDFRKRISKFFEKIRAAYLLHRAHPEEEVLLFSSQDLSALFAQQYREHLSLEGFHSVAISLLEALLAESTSEAETEWIIEQISHLHLRIARLQSSTSQNNTLAADRREWVSFHMVDDALREDRNTSEAYRLILGEFARLGVPEADLFLLPESVAFIGSRSFALSDTLQPIGSLSHGEITVADHADTVVMQDVLDIALPRYDAHAVCTVGGVMAGNELMGIAVLDAGPLNDNGQLMAFLNLGFALKHMQMMTAEREMNDLLNKNNLLLARESQHDELTGLLNRRGFMNRLEHLLGTSSGRRGAIAYLDLDGLKTINDTLGHDMGDDAIRNTARILRANVPDDGLLARLGGDEFVAFLYASDDQELSSHATAIQNDMAAHNERHETPYELSISFGAVSFVIGDETIEDVPQLMAQADERLYAMKRTRHTSRRFRE